MKFLSDRMTSASGSIGGTTFSHNRSGMYTRARRVPVNPNTTFQQAQRTAFTSASAGWRALTSARRAAWETYAAATPVVNPLGQTVYLTGFQQFVASASFALRLSFPMPTDAPTTPGRAALGMPAIVIDQSASTAAITALDSAANGATLALFLGDPVSAGVSFFAGPYQYRGGNVVVANATTIASVSGRNSMPLVVGQRLPYRLAGVLDAQNYRLTQQATGIAVVVP